MSAKIGIDSPFALSFSSSHNWFWHLNLFWLWAMHFCCESTNWMHVRRCTQTYTRCYKWARKPLELLWHSSANMLSCEYHRFDINVISKCCAFFPSSVYPANKLNVNVSTCRHTLHHIRLLLVGCVCTRTISHVDAYAGVCVCMRVCVCMCLHKTTVQSRLSLRLLSENSIYGKPKVYMDVDYVRIYQLFRPRRMWIVSKYTTWLSFTLISQNAWETESAT